MNVLVYSTKCEHCADVISFIQKNESLMMVTKFHDINSKGVPKGISRVPTLITKNQMYIGRDILDYLEQLVPASTESFSFTSFGTSVEGVQDEGNLDNFGKSLEPKFISKELQERISMSVNDSYQMHKDKKI